MYLDTQEKLKDVKTLAKRAYDSEGRTKTLKALVEAVKRLETALKKEEADRDACQGLGPI